MRNLSIITTGTYNYMSKQGAYGCILINTENESPIRGLVGCYKKSTAPRLELLAIIRILEEIDFLYPGESIQIELTSKLNYITQPFEKGKLIENLQRGKSLPNYVLWKRLYDLGNRHIWRVIKLKSPLLERFHTLALTKAREEANSPNAIEDERTPKAKAVFDLDDNVDAKKLSTDNPIKPEDGIQPNSDMPIIENNDPPF